jgi:hypothetical protein
VSVIDTAGDTVVGGPIAVGNSPLGIAIACVVTPAVVPPPPLELAPHFTG